MRVNPRLRNLKAVFKTHIDVVHFKVKNTHASRSAENQDSFTEEREAYLKGIAKTVQFDDGISIRFLQVFVITALLFFFSAG